MSDDITLNFAVTVPGDDDLAELDRIAAGSGDVSADDIRLIARNVALVSRASIAHIAFLQRLASIGKINLS